MPLVEDNPSIRNECELLRRIPLKFGLTIVWNDNEKRWRPSSASFRDHPNGTPMSVVLGDELEAAGRDAAEGLIGHSDFVLAAITAGVARSNQQQVARDPLPEEPAHGLVIGEKRKGKMTASWPRPQSGSLHLPSSRRLSRCSVLPSMTSLGVCPVIVSCYRTHRITGCRTSPWKYYSAQPRLS